ncbi:MAG TPA: hypothetical protein VLB12_07165 [Gemmatimonadales bacterium]|nr:hypothetical protein [Gemmatimonadales bacterium]
MKHELAIVALWAIAILVTILTVKQEGVLTVLLPVYAVCMIGSIVTVRAARSSSGQAAA